MVDAAASLISVGGGFAPGTRRLVRLHIHGLADGRRQRSLLKYGENFVLCSPKENNIVTAEARVVDQVFTSRTPPSDGAEWRMPDAQAQLFAFYGQNVSSTHGDTWKRHRKITGSAFSERTMEYVWNEAVLRSSALRIPDSTTDDLSLAQVRTTFDVLAMQILTVTGFGQDTDLTGVHAGHKQSLMDALGFIMENIMLNIAFNSLRAPDAMLPDLLRRLKSAVREFKMYMEETVLRHLQTARTKSEGASGRPTSLLEGIVRANEAAMDEGKGLWLSDSELYGNIFVFNLAGYEATASTFTFALSYLALHPEVQTWVMEEIDTHYGQAAPGGERGLLYSHTCPKLVRCLAVMYETLRLASHAPMFVKAPTAPTTLHVTSAGQAHSRSITVRSGTLVGFNMFGAHLSPKWGSDMERFSPARFLVTDESAAEAKVVVPNDVVYLPWLAGPRVCPGRKFSQVEFVGVLAAVLSKWRVEAARVDGECETQAQARLAEVLSVKHFQATAGCRAEVCEANIGEAEADGLGSMQAACRVESCSPNEHSSYGSGLDEPSIVIILRQVIGSDEAFRSLPRTVKSGFQRPTRHSAFGVGCLLQESWMRRQSTAIDQHLQMLPIRYVSIKGMASGRRSWYFRPSTVDMQSQPRNPSEWTALCL